MRTILVTILVLILLSGAAFAHGWYDGSCCSNTDCEPIEIDAVEEVREGWLIKLYAGEHKMLKTKPLFHLVPRGQEKVSRDQRYHVCIGDQQQFLCLYVPPPGY